MLCLVSVMARSESLPAYSACRSMDLSEVPSRCPAYRAYAALLAAAGPEEPVAEGDHQAVLATAHSR